MLVEGLDGKQWYFVYYVYENGYYNFGCQMFFELVEWMEDGWVKVLGYDVVKFILMLVGGEVVLYGFLFFDNFSMKKIGNQWSFFMLNGLIVECVCYENGVFVVKVIGILLKDGLLFLFVSGDQVYEMEVEVDCDDGVVVGLFVFYSECFFVGLGFLKDSMFEYCRGDIQMFLKQMLIGCCFFL